MAEHSYKKGDKAWLDYADREDREAGPVVEVIAVTETGRMVDVRMPDSHTARVHVSRLQPVA